MRTAPVVVLAPVTIPAQDSVAEREASLSEFSEQLRCWVLPSFFAASTVDVVERKKFNVGFSAARTARLFFGAIGGQYFKPQPFSFCEIDPTGVGVGAVATYSGQLPRRSFVWRKKRQIECFSSLALGARGGFGFGGLFPIFNRLFSHIYG